MRTTFVRLLTGESLTTPEAYALMCDLMRGDFTPAQMGAILGILRVRGETKEELLGFAQAMRDFAVPFVVPSGVLVADNCGTGGDGQHTLNISTGAALLAFALGVPVVKHGNRSVSSRSGSADFLENLGFPVDLPKASMEALFAKTGFAFLYAPLYHPAMRTVQGVRKELGVRTVFNILGPLTTPCSIAYKMVGVYDPKLLEPVAYVLLLLGVRRGLVVWGEPGVDEVSVSGVTHCILVSGGKMEAFSFHPREVGLPEYPVEAIRGGDAKDNVRLFLAVLQNTHQGAHYDALVLNAAFLVWLAERADTVSQAFAQVKEAIQSGKALARVRELVAVAQRMRGGEGHGEHS
ncbi:MAG: anthranilate phosphoribosyltransferase [Candidatus Caldatribacterium sp.]|uniref:anthranilate phosphoribosyltransferase n=1 Tax=Candidatus Caldatribacterium sp. TaxID=2282143 RepID=UPI0029983BB3|nr:anthranilate phosphoribosyltransferase [Candidatus Caldatribacterium sp.]MCX7730424.1 anthranilate phosphoribosyltransferase [Candidatus Caldatribacterium sp.]MDW8080540.1 anthranilate phosphoribosyltransferase [Candidatus Calescibacterium sp.]